MSDGQNIIMKINMESGHMHALKGTALLLLIRQSSMNNHGHG